MHVEALNERTRSEEVLMKTTLAFTLCIQDIAVKYNIPDEEVVTFVQKRLKLHLEEA